MKRDEILAPYLMVFGLTQERLLSKNRSKLLAYVRRVISHDLRKKGYTLEKIGYILKRDHSTIIYHLSEYENSYRFDPDFREIANKINH